MVLDELDEQIDVDTLSYQQINKLIVGLTLFVLISDETQKELNLNQTLLDESNEIFSLSTNCTIKNEVENMGLKLGKFVINTRVLNKIT